MGNTSPTPRALLVEAIIFWTIGVVLYGGRMFVPGFSFINGAILTMG